MGVFWQVVSVFSACFACMTTGLVLTCPASVGRVFECGDTPLVRPMTPTEVALLWILPSIGALISTPITSCLLDRLGRRICIILNAAMFVISWSVVATTTQVETVLLSSFIAGCGAGSCLAVPVYITEVCQASIRGAMTSMTILFYTAGTMLSYIFAGCLEYDCMNYVTLTLAIIGVVIAATLKETPVMLIRMGSEREALKALAFYRGVHWDSKEIQTEIAQIHRTLNLDLNDLLPDEEKVFDTAAVTRGQNTSVIEFLKTSQSTRHGLYMCLVLTTAAVFNSLVVIQDFTEVLFKETIPRLSNTRCIALVFLAAMLANAVGAILCETVGRKHLMIWASLACGLLCSLLGCQFHLHSSPPWLTVSCLLLYLIAFTIGAGTLPFVIAAEIFTPEIKSYALGIILEWIYLCYFIIQFILDPLLQTIGMGAVFYTFALISFFTAIFSIYFVPETKNMSVDDKQALLDRRQFKRRLYEV